MSKGYGTQTHTNGCNSAMVNRNQFDAVTSRLQLCLQKNTRKFLPAYLTLPQRREQNFVWDKRKADGRALSLGSFIQSPFPGPVTMLPCTPTSAFALLAKPSQDKAEKLRGWLTKPTLFINTYPSDKSPLV